MYINGKTFEPTYGDVYDETNSFERTVVVCDSSTAESYFCGLVGWSESCLKETSEGYTDSAQGYLVCMESGKGSYWQNYCSEDWGCWKPKDKWRDAMKLFDEELKK